MILARRAALSAALAFGAATLAAALWVAWRYHVVTPFSDIWLFYRRLLLDDGQLSWAHTWAPHNEHRVVFLRPILYADSLWARGTGWLACGLTLASLAGTAVLWASQIQRHFPGNVPRWIAISLITGIIFLPAQGWVFTLAFPCHIPLALLLMTVACRYFSDYLQTERIWTLVIALVVAIVAIFAWTTALALWPAFGLAALLQRRYRVLPLALAGGLIAFFLNWIGNDSAHISLLTRHNGIVPVIHGFFVFLGGFNWFLGPRAALFTGLGWMAVTLWLLWMARRSATSHRFFWFSFLTSVTGASSAALISLGRVSGGLSQVAQPHYETVNALAWAGTLGLLASLPESRYRWSRALVLTPYLIVFALPLVFLHRTVGIARGLAGAELGEAMSLLSRVDDRAALAPNSGDDEHSHSVLRFFERRHWNIYADSRFPLLDQPLASLAQQDAPCALSQLTVTWIFDNERPGIRIVGSIVPGMASRQVIVDAADRIIGFGEQHPDVRDKWIGYAHLSARGTAWRVLSWSDGHVCEIARGSSRHPLLPAGQEPVAPSLFGIYHDRQLRLDINGDITFYPPDGDLILPLIDDRVRVVVMAPRRGGPTAPVQFLRGEWFLNQAKIGHFGASGDTPVAGDWDGSGWRRAGVYRDGLWRLDMDGDLVWNPLRDKELHFAPASGEPVTGAWQGRGTTKLGIFRDGHWWLDIDGDGHWDPARDKSVVFGGPGSRPIVGDWDFIGYDRIGVVTWGNQWLLDWDGDFVFTRNEPDTVRGFGEPSDRPLAGISRPPW